jgi:uncharacterized protein
MTQKQNPIGTGFTAASTADDVLAGIDLSGTNVVITGGHVGLGLETTRALSKADASVTVGSRNPDRAAAALAGLERVEVSRLDLLGPASIDAFAARYLDSSSPPNRSPPSSPACSAHIAVAVAWQRARAGDWTGYAAKDSRRTNQGIAVSHNDEQPAHDSAVISSERAAEVEHVIDRVTRWAADRDDIVGLLLVGSCARNAARRDSDIDLVVLTRDTTRYADSAWADELAIGELIRTRSWGPITEQRFATTSGLEVEIDIGCPDWARVNPIDPGTRRVVTDGARILHDPTRMLATLLRACQN